MKGIFALIIAFLLGFSFFTISSTKSYQSGSGIDMFGHHYKEYTIKTRKMKIVKTMVYDDVYNGGKLLYELSDTTYVKR